MALQQISVVSIYVSDQEKALDFYTNKLGFTKSADAEFGEGMRWLEVKTPEGTTTLSILKATDYAGTEMGKHTDIVFYSDDVRGTCADFKAKGVNITEEANSQSWGVQAQFTDPDGNGYAIVGK